MTVLQSSNTGADVNLTSATGWTPAQIPADGDVLILNNATLRMDADRVLKSLVFAHSRARIGLGSIANRTLTCTDGFEITAAVNNGIWTGGGAGVPIGLPAGVRLTLIGQWFGPGSITAGVSFAGDGELVLQTVGNDPTKVLFADTAGQRCVANGGGYSGLISTTGLIDLPSAIGSWAMIQNFSFSGSGFWTHNSVGLNRIGVSGGSTASVRLSSGGIGFDWRGSLDAYSTGVMFSAGSPNLINKLGRTGDVIRSLKVGNSLGSSNSLFSASGTNAKFILEGSVSSGNGAWTVINNGATVEYKNQTAYLPAGGTFQAMMPGGTLDVSGLDLTVAETGQLLISSYGSSNVVVDSNTYIRQAGRGRRIAINAPSAIATAFYERVFINEKVVPANVADVKGGVQFGWQDDLQIGTATIFDQEALSNSIRAGISADHGEGSYLASDVSVTEVLDAIGNLPPPTVTVLPLNAAVQSRTTGTTIEVFFNAASVIALGVTDAAGQSVDLESRTLEFVIEFPRSRQDKLVIPDGELGKMDSTLSILIPKSATGKLGTFKWALWDKAADELLLHGLLQVAYAPKANAS